MYIYIRKKSRLTTCISASTTTAQSPTQSSLELLCYIFTPLQDYLHKQHQAEL